MTEDHERLVEKLAGYALGALEASERAEVETHIATCATCARRLEEYRHIVGALAMGLEPVAPPPAAWATIRAGARQRGARARRWTRGIGLPDRLRAVRWPALVAVLASLLIWNVVLHRELARRAPGPDPGPEVQALARRPGRVVVLAGTGAPAVAGATFRVNTEGLAWVKVTVPVPFEDVRAISVTEEAAPGSAAPTGRQLLAAQL